MSGDRARRTSSGSTLRLVGGAQSTEQTAEQTAEDGEPGASPEVPEPGAEPGLISIVLPGQRQSVAIGRHWVVRTSAEHGVTGMANQVVELLSSELLANAVLHGAEGSAIGVQLRRTAEALRVSVSDAGASTPVVLHREPSAPNGRGMAIVEAMSSRWGVDEHDEGGKTVWFELDLEDF
ncbi:ATP-binding protein [Actinotalea subterranea]|uniref:ATP-binding protein n=1 Tax=Actinotalea subterranea TaxID=2607497 RepID=UPI0011EF6012|nr:ATP-binding protein [Actinotalea subterranea]